MSCKDAAKIVNRYSKEGTLQASGQHTSGGKWNNQKSRPKPYEYVRYYKVGSSTSGPSGPETLKTKTNEDQEKVIPLLYDDMINGLQLRMTVRRDLASYVQLAFIGKRLVYGTEEGLRPIDTFYSEEAFGAVEFYWKELSQWDRLVTEWDTVFNVATAFKVEPPNN